MEILKTVPDQCCRRTTIWTILTPLKMIVLVINWRFELAILLFPKQSYIHSTILKIFLKMFSMLRKRKTVDMKVFDVQLAEGFADVHGGCAYGLRNTEGGRIIEFSIALDLVVTTRALRNTPAISLSLNLVEI